MRTTREEWRKRIERWRDSGLTAEEFASEIGINPRTLAYYKYVLGKEAAKTPEKPAAAKRPRATRAAAPAAPAPPVIEVRAVAADARFELEVGRGRRIWVPPGFDASALQRLLSVMEAG